MCRSQICGLLISTLTVTLTDMHTYRSLGTTLDENSIRFVQTCLVAFSISKNFSGTRLTISQVERRLNPGSDDAPASCAPFCPGPVLRVRVGGTSSWVQLDPAGLQHRLAHGTLNLELTPQRELAVMHKAGGYCSQWECLWVLCRSRRAG